MKRKYIYIIGGVVILFFLLRKEKLPPDGFTYYNPLRVPYKSRGKTEPTSREKTGSTTHNPLKIPYKSRGKTS